MAAENSNQAIETIVARNRIVVRTSVIGIVSNVLLAAFKALVGTLSGSIAIVLDAVNNLSDAMSSLITIIGTKLARRPADHEHPFGHGRVEYLSAIVISAIVLAAGVTSLKESVMAIIHPERPNYDAATLVVVAVAVVAKIVLGSFFKRVGKSVSSDSLVASGTDATMDAVISSTTLVAALVSMFAGPSVEAPLAAVISLVIVKSGIDMLRETLGKVLGARVDADLAHAVKDAANSVDGVLGAYDLILNDYGPERLQGSIHVEVADDTTALEIDDLTREVRKAVFESTGVIITTVGVYATGMGDEVKRVGEEVRSIVLAHDNVHEVHGLYVRDNPKQIRFDVIICFDEPDIQGAYRAICEEVSRRFPEYEVQATLDADISD